MSRCSHTYHAVRHIDTTGHLESDRKWLWGMTWCGQRGGTSLSNMPEGEDPLAYSRRMADCPKCATAIGKARLDQLDGRVVLERVELKPNSYYRTAWLIKIDGEPLAHAVMRNGWGNPWELKSLPDHWPNEPANCYHEFGATISDIPNRHNRTTADRTFQIVHSASKEMMAAAAFRARERGELLTIPEREAKAEAYKARRAIEDAEREEARRLAGIERERKDGLRAERKATALAGLEDALGRDDLTNLQRAGLEAARDIINGKDVL